MVHPDGQISSDGVFKLSANLFGVWGSDLLGGGKITDFHIPQEPQRSEGGQTWKDVGVNTEANILFSCENRQWVKYECEERWEMNVRAV